MPLPEFSGTLGLKRAAHLLRRATFGATKQQIDSFATLTPAQAITSLFRQALPDPILPIDPKTGTEWVLSGITDANSKSNELEDYFKGWFVGQMMSSGIAPGFSLGVLGPRKTCLFSAFSFYYDHVQGIQQPLSLFSESTFQGLCPGCTESKSRNKL